MALLQVSIVCIKVHPLTVFKVDTEVLNRREALVNAEAKELPNSFVCRDVSSHLILIDLIALFRVVQVEDTHV